MPLRHWLSLAFVGLLCASCGESGKALADRSAIAQMVGEVVASFEEAGEAGAFALGPGRVPRPLRTQSLSPAWDWLVPTAHAAEACYAVAFSPCAAGKRVRKLEDCTVGGGKLKGNVVLQFLDPRCVLGQDGAAVARIADFTLESPRGTLAVSSPGGQRVIKIPTGFAYEVLGVRRALSDSGGKLVSDVTAKTTDPISVTGDKRPGRAMNGGRLELHHETHGYTVKLVPEDVRWEAGCACPTRGRFRGTVEGAADVSATFELELDGCAKATLTAGAKTEEVELDRCAPL